MGDRMGWGVIVGLGEGKGVKVEEEGMREEGRYFARQGGVERGGAGATRPSKT